MSQLTMQNGAPVLKLTRSSHNLSNQKIFDVEQNWLVPTAVYDVVPGDKFNLKTSHLIRTTPLVKPAMVIDLMAKTMSAYVSYRTVWKPFEEFFSGGRTGNKVVPLPIINIKGTSVTHCQQYSLFDYFDLPCPSSNGSSGSDSYSTFINALYILSYLKIWSDYFRNPSLDVEIDVLNLTIYKPNDDTPYTFPSNVSTFSVNGVSYQGVSITNFVVWCLGLISNQIPLSDLTASNITTYPPNTASNNFCRPAIVNLPRDLFTSALPTASLSNPVSLGLSGNLGSGAISGSGFLNLNTLADLDPNSGYGFVVNEKTPRVAYIDTLSKGTLGVSGSNITGAPGVTKNMLTVTSVGLSSSTIARSLNFNGGDVNISGIYPRELRLVFGLDLKQQIRNLTGNRYKDLTKAFYGVDIQDYRVDMAVYIGGGRSPIYTSEVLQTSESNETPLGEQAGHAISSGIHNHGSYFVRELGCILNLMWINSHLPYSQSLRRDWRKFSINDFFFPMFEKLGDQEIYQEEVNHVFGAGDTNNFRIFGFAPRYSEYKFYNHTVCGGIRGNYRYWTQSRYFGLGSGEKYTPTLSPDFIKPSIVSVNRIFQTIQGSNYTLKPYIVKFENRTIAYRPMEENTLGYLIDHF